MLLTFNAGSSTVKIGLFGRVDGRCLRIGKGTIDFRRRPLTFHLTEGPATADVALAAAPDGPIEDVLAETFQWLAQHFDIAAVTAVAHRVVHGGDAYSQAVLIDDAALDGITALTPLAPLHQPQCVRLIRAIRHLRPALPQTASFDTAFHRTQGDVVRRFALPRVLHDAGIKRYGFHGLSYAFIARELARLAPTAAEGKVVAAHLGSGASLCALEAGVSRDTSMGFSTLDGIPMATRCGALDPGVILYLLEDGTRDLAAVNDILYKQSGLLGMSGISADSRELLASDEQAAREALDVFAFRIAGEIARLAATLGGLDAVVFTAGIGENQPQVRAAVAKRLAWLGLALDGRANLANAEVISAAGSHVSAFVIPTDEEQVIADEAEVVLAQALSSGG
nr:acetate/propionate family kinase [Chelatococcus sp. YT9]